MTDDEPKVPKVKDLLGGGASLSDVVDPATRAELERWFGLPSYTELAERGEEPAEDPEMVAARERRETATARVDPALLESLRRRSDVELLPVRVAPKLHADRRIARIDLERVEQIHTAIAEPREVERPEFIEDALKEVTPQALLRDLHRSEETFDKSFEIVDMAAEQRFDIVAEVAQAMATDLRLPPLGPGGFRQGYALVQEAQRLRRTPFTWVGLPTPYRWVKDWS